MKVRGLNRRVAAVFFAILSAVSAPSAFAQDVQDILNTADNIFAPLTVTDEDILQLTRQMIRQQDARHNVATVENAYFKRLERILTGLRDAPPVPGQPPWDFRVYVTPEINATATPDGSVRVRSGVMDLLNDEELIAILGHEAAHVLYGHGLKRVRGVLFGNSLQSLVNLTNARATTVQENQLRAFGVAMANSAYSRELETQADCYGLYLLIYNDLDPESAVRGYRKISDAKEVPANLTKTLLAQHPSWEGRIANFEQLIDEWEMEPSAEPPTAYDACKQK